MARSVVQRGPRNILANPSAGNTPSGEGYRRGFPSRRSCSWNRFPGLAEDLLLSAAKRSTRRDGSEPWSKATCRQAFLDSDKGFTVCNKGLGVAAVPSG